MSRQLPRQLTDSQHVSEWRPIWRRVPLWWLGYIAWGAGVYMAVSGLMYLFQ